MLIKFFLIFSYFIRRQKNDANDADINFIPAVALIELEWLELNRKLIFMIFFQPLLSSRFPYLLSLFAHVVQSLQNEFSLNSET